MGVYLELAGEVDGGDSADALPVQDDILRRDAWGEGVGEMSL